MSAAFYRLRPASSTDFVEQQKVEQTQASQQWQSANLPTGPVNVDAPTETVNLSKFEASCHKLEHDVKENIIYRAALHGMLLALLVDALWCSYHLLLKDFNRDVISAAAHILILPWALCAFILHAPRYFTSVFDALKEGCSLAFLPSVLSSARTILCIQSSLSGEKPEYVDIISAFFGAIWMLADVYRRDSVCDIRWRDHWLENNPIVQRMEDRPLSILSLSHWKLFMIRSLRSIFNCSNQSEVWRSIQRIEGIYILLYGIILILLVCMKNWLKILSLGAIALSPRPSSGLRLAYTGFSNPSEAIGGTLRSFLNGIVAIMLMNLIIQFVLHQTRDIKKQLKPVRAKDLQIALSTPSLLVQMMGFKCIVDALQNVDQHTIELVRNRADAPRARNSQTEAARSIVPAETLQLLTADQMSVREIVTRRSIILLNGATAVADAIGELLLNLPKDGVCTVTPFLRERLRKALRQMKGNRFEVTPRYIALSNVLADKAPATISERGRLVFINELRGLLIAILTTAFASLKAVQSLAKIKVLASRVASSAVNTTASSPTKFIPSLGLNSAVCEPEESVREELIKLESALKRLLAIPACPPHSPKLPDFDVPCEQFRSALSHSMLDFMNYQ